MTLHWWMHWFWVTTLLILYGSCWVTFAAPQSEELLHMSTDLEVSTQRHPDRQSRAMYYTKAPTGISNTTKTPPANYSIETNQTTNKDVTKEININLTVKNFTLNPILPESQEVEETTEMPKVTEDNQNNVTEVNLETNLTTSPRPNNMTEQNATLTTRRRNLTRADIIKDEGNSEGISESKIVTDRPLSLEIRTRIPPNIESSRRIIDVTDGGMDTGAIAGISFAALVLTALAGSTAFVLYRRRYLNKPQTLNDKCSNPDSSGYLDDSTIRDNSEEMYSLDNDSFLNSLEAMTIQNYWTDTVKHTKL